MGAVKVTGGSVKLLEKCEVVRKCDMQEMLRCFGRCDSCQEV